MAQETRCARVVIVISSSARFNISPTSKCFFYFPSIQKQRPMLSEQQNNTSEGVKIQTEHTNLVQKSDVARPRRSHDLNVWCVVELRGPRFYESYRKVSPAGSSFSRMSASMTPFCSGLKWFRQSPTQPFRMNGEMFKSNICSML